MTRSPPKIEDHDKYLIVVSGRALLGAIMKKPFENYRTGLPHMSISMDNDKRVDDPSRAFQRGVRVVLWCAVCGVERLCGVCCVLCGVCCVVCFVCWACCLCALIEPIFRSFGRFGFY